MRARDKRKCGVRKKLKFELLPLLRVIRGTPLSSALGGWEGKKKRIMENGEANIFEFFYCVSCTCARGKEKKIPCGKFTPFRPLPFLSLFRRGHNSGKKWRKKEDTKKKERRRSKV